MKTILLIFWLTTFTHYAMAIEEPKYRLIDKSEAFELRSYEPMIIAETLISGSPRNASNSGFRVIADYIFGNNSMPSGESKKIAMTSPVTTQAESKKISMTAPVTMEQQDNQWRMHFVMPSQYRLEDLPKPNNQAVNLRAIPSRNYAVVRFSGLASVNKVEAKTKELMAWLNEKNIQPIGAPELARYDPPWTLPFMRRNEIMIQY